MQEWFMRLRDWMDDHLNWKILGIVLLVVAVLAFCGGNAYQDWRAQGEGLTLVKDSAEADASDTSASAENAPASGEVVVHVTGAVNAPGVYTLPADARVDDAVRAAGATAEADLSQLNLAQKLADGQKITVPAVGASADTGGEATAAASGDSGGSALVNINTATLEELETLPSIGEVRAQAIITYRETNGGFRTIDDIKEVSGIGEKIFADIAPYITV